MSTSNEEYKIEIGFAIHNDIIVEKDVWRRT